MATIMINKLKAIKRRLFLKRDGEQQLKNTYKFFHGKDLDINSAHTFTQKLYKRMIYTQRYGNKTFSKLSDKYAVRKFISSTIGDKYLIKLLWSGQNPESIPFETLPKKYIIKTNHGSGGNIIVEGTPDKVAIIKKLKEILNQNFYWQAREYQYFNIKPRVIIEEFLDDLSPLDYRFFCFDGEPEIIQIDNHLHDINPFYDTNWNKIDLSYRKDFKDFNVERPENFDSMLNIAKQLSKNFDFVRVDLYNIKGHIFFGEMTFTPVAGQFRFNSDKWDEILGKKWIWRDM